MKFEQHWQLNPELTFLNHGCFGAVPRVVMQAVRSWREELESDPIHFLAPERELEPKLDHVRSLLGDLVGAEPANLAFVRNATDGVNAVLRSMSLSEGDEVLITNHGYNACNNVARYVAERSGATVQIAEIPYPLSRSEQILDAVEEKLSSRTRLVLVDHVTSPTALIFPVKQIVELTHDRGARVMIDGAHAAGMLSLQVEQIGADYYTANHHKWLCSPKVSGFLYVNPRWQDEVQPTVISHSYNRPRNNRSAWQSSFDWVGTYDPTPILAIPTAIDFLSSLFADGFQGYLRRNHDHLLKARDLICQSMRIGSPAPDSMLGSMLAVPLDAVLPEQVESLGQRLRKEFGIEIPVYPGLTDAEDQPAGQPMMRISMQVYNTIEDIERLRVALQKIGLV